MRSALIGAFLCIAANASAAPPLSHLGAQPGEAFTFKFSVGEIESGRARMSVGMPIEKNGKRVVAVHGQAETLPWLRLLARMNDDYQLHLDAATLLPLRVSSVEHGVRERTIVTVVDGRTADLDYVLPQRGKGKARRALPDVVRDPLSALFAVRATPLRDNEIIEMHILDGLILWRTRLTVHREKLRIAADGPGAPPRAAVRLDGENLRVDDAGKPAGQPPRKFTVWLSDDGNRALLRMEAHIDLGQLAVELTSYQPGRTRAAAPTLPGVVVRSPAAFKQRLAKE